MKPGLEIFLKPIRDLASLWNITIAEELEQYVEELQHISFSFADGSGSSNLNFAEAALIIQGAACAYSKKVESLYDLVCKVLEYLAEKKRRQQSESADAAVRTQANDFDDFGALDLVLRKANNIDLEYSRDDVLEDGGCTPKIPISLLPLDLRKPMMSVHKDAIRRNEFRMTVCHVDSNGAIMIDDDGLNLGNENGNITSAASVPVPPIADFPILPTPARSIHPNEMSQGDAPIPLPDMDDGDEQVLDTPWGALDPYANDGPKPIPFKKGKPFTVPPQYEELRKQLFTQGTRVFVSSLGFKVRTADNKPVRGPNPPDYDTVRGLVFAEFEYKLDAEDKHRREVIKQKPKVANGKYSALADMRQTAAAEEDVGIPLPQITDDDDDGAGAGGAIVLPDVGELPIGNIENSVDIPRRTIYAQDDPLRTIHVVPSSVDAFLNSANTYTVVTDIGAKVAEWEKKLTPILANLESQPTYDIHTYSGKLLNKFQALDKTTAQPFSTVVKGESPAEVCRLFLAGLMLANHGNVAIVDQSGVFSMQYQHNKLHKDLDADLEHKTRYLTRNR